MIYVSPSPDNVTVNLFVLSNIDGVDADLSVFTFMNCVDDTLINDSKLLV